MGAVQRRANLIGAAGTGLLGGDCKVKLEKDNLLDYGQGLIQGLTNPHVSTRIV